MAVKSDSEIKPAMKLYGTNGRTLPPHKRLVNYKDGAEIYCMGITKFQEMAKDARAVYKFNQVVVVDLDIFDEYIEGFRL